MFGLLSFIVGFYLPAYPGICAMDLICQWGWKLTFIVIGLSIIIITWNAMIRKKQTFYFGKQTPLKS
jgi:hypothetical protein